MDNNDQNQTNGGEGNNTVQKMLDLEALIRRYLKDMEQLREDMKAQKAMFDDSFKNDVKYKESEDKVKAIAREKAAAKQLIMKTPAVQDLDLKLRDMKEELKDMEDALSGYVREYQRISGASQLEGENGEILEIVTKVKLVRKSKKEA